MRTVEFYRILDADNILRVRFDTERGHVLSFTVQLVSRFGANDDWIAVVRYDTAHGFAHMDRLHAYQETVKVIAPTHNCNDALFFAISDFAENWTKYRKRYQEWKR